MATAATIRVQVESALARKYPSALTPPPRMVRPVVSSGIGALDELVQGGLPVGALTELVGEECSGRMSLALSFLSQITAMGKVCAWIDASNTFDPSSAASVGVDLKRLLWVRCGVSEATVERETRKFALPAACFAPKPGLKGLHGGGHGSCIADCRIAPLERSVVCAPSYEARRSGVRSAMPAITAERMCPEAVFLPPDFVRYKAVSRTVREIFQRHTDEIEPLSLDEAYLDVTVNKTGLKTATLVAKTIRQQIWDELHLTASAGVAPNKFIAKIASDWKKPNGQFVVQPHEVQAFLLPLAVGKIPGVGKVTEARMAEVGIKTVRDIHAMDLSTLEGHFGRWGTRLFQLARGIDHNPVVSNRIRKQVSAEDTFPDDIPLAECDPHIRRLAEKVWVASQGNARDGRTVVLKLKTKEFYSLTRSLTPPNVPTTCEEFTELGLQLCSRVALGETQLYRLVGIGLSNFEVDRHAEQISGLLDKAVAAPTFEGYGIHSL